eukprot:122268_1
MHRFQWYNGNDPLVIQFMISIQMPNTYSSAGIEIFNGRTSSPCQFYYIAIQRNRDSDYIYKAMRFPKYKGDYTTLGIIHDPVYPPLSFSFVQNTFYPVTITISKSTD